MWGKTVSTWGRGQCGRESGLGPRETYRCLEYTLIAPVGIRGLAHLLLGSVGVDDPVLAGDLVAVPIAILLLLLEVVLELLLEVAVEGLELPLLHAGAAVGGALDIGLEVPDLVADAGVLELGGGDQVVETALGGVVGADQRVMVQAGNALNVGCEGADLIANV